MQKVHVSTISLALAFCLLCSPTPMSANQATPQADLDALVQGFLWPSTSEEFAEARAGLDRDGGLLDVDRLRWHELEAIMRLGRVSYPALSSDEELIEMSVETPGGREVPVLVRLPSDYDAEQQWPLMFAMHGGPPGSVEGAVAGAGRMASVWAPDAERAGWIIASPAMVDVVSAGGRTRDRLPYEVFHPEEAWAVIQAVRARFNVNPDRIVSTGISLGSNFSIAYGAAHPDWFSAIVPVSTEGDSRERLLRNLATVPTYVLEGSQDRNIRGVGGPRSLDLIMTGLGLDLVYREFGDRAHEGFQEHYADVLRWLDGKPRRSNPAEVWRVPHSGIMPVARSVHWIESSTRQGIIHARVMDPQRIDIRAARTDELTVYLNDGIVNLDGPIEIWVNGEIAFEGRVPRSIPFALERARELQDERRIYAGSVTVAVPTGREANRIAGEVSAEVVPNFPEGTLSFWEMYAVRALEERFPVLGFSGEVAPFPDSGGGPAQPVAAGQVAVRVTEVTSGSPWEGSDLRVGDLVLEVGGEPFLGQPFLGGSEKGDPLLALREWLLRELRGYPQDYSVRILRGNQEIRLQVPLSLGDYTAASDEADTL